jgi:putative serine protease PepD
LAVWRVALVAGSIGAILATAATVATGVIQPRQSTVAIPALERMMETAAVVASPDLVLDTPEMASRIKPALVSFEAGGSRRGTGTVFRSDGFVLTSASAVPASGAVTAVLDNGRRVAGRVLGSDRATAIAVVKLDGAGFATAMLASGDALQPGDPAAAMADAASQARALLVSTSLTAHDGEPAGAVSVVPSLPSNASGAPLVDSRGAVVAIAVRVDNGQSLAEPIGLAHDAALRVMARNHYRVAAAITGDKTREALRSIGAGATGLLSTSAIAA